MDSEPEAPIVDGDRYDPPAIHLIGSVADLTLRLHSRPGHNWHHQKHLGPPGDWQYEPVGLTDPS
jgi:hypothetical protein